MTGNFQKDLAFGKDAEAKFAIRFPELKHTDGYKGDFIMPCGSILELKCDKYCHDKWPNLIIERFRSAERNGGPYQSLDHGAKFFAYNFTKGGQLYLFDTQELVNACDRIAAEHCLQLQGIGNKTYTTRFYRIPRIYLTNIMLPLTLLGVENVS